MPQRSRLSAVLGIGSHHNMFIRARLKLTALYVLIVALIITGFSLFLYHSISSNLGDASQDEFSDSQHQQAFIGHTLDDTQNNILIADIFILLTAAGLSYILAGYTLKPIQRSVEAQRAFASNASHELRTPLAVMKNGIEVLLRNKNYSKDDTERTFNSNLEEITHMSSMVQDLLFLARSDNQGVTEMSTIDMANIVKLVTDRMRPLALNKGIQLNYEIIASNPLLIQASIQHLERAIINIIQNSIEHTPTGGSITISLMNDSKEAHVQIIDTGTGIEPKNLPLIFTRFHKGESSQGTGLGLSIVKEIIDQHHGSVDVVSSVGIGTTVSIHIPLI